MKKRFSVQQMVGVLKQAEVGVWVGNRCGRWGFPNRHSSGGRSGARSWRLTRSGN